LPHAELRPAPPPPARRPGAHPPSLPGRARPRRAVRCAPLQGTPHAERCLRVVFRAWIPFVIINQFYQWFDTGFSGLWLGYANLQNCLEARTHPAPAPRAAAAPAGVPRCLPTGQRHSLERCCSCPHAAAPTARHTPLPPPPAAGVLVPGLLDPVASDPAVRVLAAAVPGHRHRVRSVLVLGLLVHGGAHVPSGRGAGLLPVRRDRVHASGAPPLRPRRRSCCGCFCGCGCGCCCCGGGGGCGGCGGCSCGGGGGFSCCRSRCRCSPLRGAARHCWERGTAAA